MTDFTPTGIITVVVPDPVSFVGFGYTMGTGLDYSGGMKVPGFTIQTVVNNTKSRPVIGLAWPRRA